MRVSLCRGSKGARMTDPMDEEFNRIEMESRIKQEYIRNMKPHVPFMSISMDDYLRLSDELAIARTLIRELGDRLAKLEVERNFCQRCGKRLVDGSIHTCTPPLEKNNG